MLTIYLIGVLMSFGFGFNMEHINENEQISWGFILAFSLMWFILVPWFIVFVIIEKIKGE
jgi:hypothetical protein